MPNDDYYDSELLKIIDYGENSDDLKAIIYDSIRSTLRKHKRPMRETILLEMTDAIVQEIDLMNIQANYDESNNNEPDVVATPVEKRDGSLVGPILAILIPFLIWYSGILK